jgi:hypothetical protein
MKGIPMSRIALRVKPIALCCVTAAALTYLSLAVPGRVNAVCGDLGTPSYCAVLAYGFPLPFLADSRVTSPVGSVGRDPLSLLTGLDDLLWGQLGLSFFFWVLVVTVSTLGWRRWARRRFATKSGGGGAA